MFSVASTPSPALHRARLTQATGNGGVQGCLWSDPGDFGHGSGGGGAPPGMLFYRRHSSEKDNWEHEPCRVDGSEGGGDGSEGDGDGGDGDGAADPRGCAGGCRDARISGPWKSGGLGRE